MNSRSSSGRRSRHASIVRAVVCLLSATALAACSYFPGMDALSDESSPDEITRAVNANAPGSLVEAKPFSDVDVIFKQLGATAVKVLYRSTSGIDGSPTEVSGSVFVPAGQPPKGGWPVVAFAHGTTGIGPECGPSLTPNLSGSIGLVAGYVQLGFAVTVADYQGLGAPGVHPYLDSKTAAFNVIDSVRALRAVSKNVSTKWAVLGASQGGAAAWAANEQTTTYASDLKLVGAVALAPLADLTGLAEAAATKTLTPDQVGVYVWMLMGVEGTRPDFPIDEYRHGTAKAKWDALRGCLGEASVERIRVLYELTPDDLVPATPEATERLTKIFQSMALPQQRGAAPMLIIYGGSDTYVDTEWTRNAIAQACALGTQIATVFQPDRGHLDLKVDEFAGWLMARMEGFPAPDTCQAP